MARARKPNIETPGAPSSDDAVATKPPESAESTGPEHAPEVPQTGAAASASPEAQEKAAKDAELAKQVENMKALVGSAAALDWSHLTSPATLAPKLANADADLPNDADIDPFKIPFGQKVLTRQGWLLSSKPDPRFVVFQRTP